METLEDRRVLANQIVWTFLLTLSIRSIRLSGFRRYSHRSRFRFQSIPGLQLGRDDFGDDAEIALHRISARVHRLLKPYREHADIDWWFGSQRTLLSQVDPGAGETRLASGQASSSLNTYVIYVGNNRPSELLPKFGAAHQAFAG